jgi:3-oxoacyl-[acyl-carrier protein] reductase
VLVSYAHNEKMAADVVAEIANAGGQAGAIQLDVADSAAVNEAVADVTKTHGRLDILVANAGIAVDGLLLRLRDEDFDHVMTVNARGALACARAAIKPMMRARRGRIVFVSSVIGEIGNIGQASYAASKAALLGVTKSLAREYASRGLTVNAVAPGIIDTDMTSRIEDELRAKIITTIPLGRFGRPEDVAAAVLFLCSEEAGYVTGQTLRVNGGMYV